MKTIKYSIWLMIFALASMAALAQTGVFSPRYSAQRTYVTEHVTCIFVNATGNESCFTGSSVAGLGTSRPGSECTGTSSCTVAITGFQGQRVIWSSSCGGIAVTTIDGQDESITFNCGNKPAQTAEQVTCNFHNSTRNETCFTMAYPLFNNPLPFPLGQRYSCTGTDSCTVTVSGPQNQRKRWGSSCVPSSYAMTTMDGQDESIDFNCMPTCMENEYRSTNYNGNHAFGVQRCKGGNWVTVSCSGQ